MKIKTCLAFFILNCSAHGATDTLFPVEDSVIQGGSFS
jgi:hypothetical protein